MTLTFLSHESRGGAIKYTYCYVYRLPVTNRPEKHTQSQPETNYYADESRSQQGCSGFGNEHVMRGIPWERIGKLVLSNMLRPVRRTYSLYIYVPVVKYRVYDVVSST